MEENKEEISRSNNLSNKQKVIREFWDLVKFAVVAFLIVIPIRMFIAQPFVVSGESMYPTFNNGEYLIVDQISYILGEPERGDVVIFKYPNDTKRYFIKRVIGMPNERIIIEDGKIKIFNKDNEDGFYLDESFLKGNFQTTNNFNSYSTKNDEYFVMGDNRDRSSDSRSWGSLPKKLITGRAYLRLLPIKNISFLPGSIK